MIVTDGVLAAALVGVYLIDGLHWLAPGEALVEWRGERAWRLAFGPSFTLAARRPCLPVPFAPSVAFRVRWRLAELAPADAPAPLAAVARALLPVAWLSTVCALLIGLVAPVLLLVGASRSFVAVALACAALALVAGAIAWRRRARLGIGGATIAATTAIAIVCLPCSGNLARTLAARSSGTAAFPDWLAAAFAGGSGRRAADAALREELTRAREWADEAERAPIDRALARLASEDA